MDQDSIIFVGLDVHKDTVAIATAVGSGGEPQFRGQVPNTPAALGKALRRLGSTEQVHCWYEAGPTGYSTWRQLTAWNFACTVVAPSLIPRKPGDQVKTDRRDAVLLARLARSGDLTAVWVPDPAHEALRDLCRAREAAKRDRERVRHRLLKLLLRLGIPTPSGMARWSKPHRTWLAALTVSEPLQQAVLEETRDQLAELEARLERLTQRVQTQTTVGPFVRLLGGLQCLNGVGPITAVTLVAELGDLTRFRRARALMGYSGLTPSEHSSGGRVRRGGVTKTGNRHVRYVVVESAWHARWGQRPASQALLKRRAGQPEAVVALAETAQVRLGRRFHALLKRGKQPQQAAVAVARELLGFVWAIGQVVAQQEQEASEEVAAA